MSDPGLPDSAPQAPGEEPPLGDPGAVPDPQTRPDEGDPATDLTGVRDMEDPAGARLEAKTRPVVNDQEPTGEQGISSDRPGVDAGGYPEDPPMDKGEGNAAPREDQT